MSFHINLIKEPDWKTFGLRNLEYQLGDMQSHTFDLHCLLLITFFFFTNGLWLNYVFVSAKHRIPLSVTPSGPHSALSKRPYCPLSSYNCTTLTLCPASLPFESKCSVECWRYLSAFMTDIGNSGQHVLRNEQTAGLHQILLWNFYWASFLKVQENSE